MRAMDLRILSVEGLPTTGTLITVEVRIAQTVRRLGWHNVRRARPNRADDHSQIRTGHLAGERCRMVFGSHAQRRWCCLRGRLGAAASGARGQDSGAPAQRPAVLTYRLLLTRPANAESDT